MADHQDLFAGILLDQYGDRVPSDWVCAEIARCRMISCAGSAPCRQAAEQDSSDPTFAKPVRRSDDGRTFSLVESRGRTAGATNSLSTNFSPTNPARRGTQITHMSGGNVTQDLLQCRVQRPKSRRGSEDELNKATRRRTRTLADVERQPGPSAAPVAAASMTLQFLRSGFRQRREWRIDRLVDVLVASPRVGPLR